MQQAATSYGEQDQSDWPPISRLHCSPAKGVARRPRIVSMRRGCIRPRTMLARRAAELASKASISRRFLPCHV